MKVVAYAICGITFVSLGLLQWWAEVDGLHEVLGWPKFLCWLVGVFTAWIPIVGTAAGVWGAHAAWGWDWLPALGLFLGWPVIALLIVGVVMAVEAAQTRRSRV